MSQIACEPACINAAARILYSTGRHGFISASIARIHETNATPRVAVTILLVTSTPVSLFLRCVALLEIFYAIGTLAAFGWPTIGDVRRLGGMCALELVQTTAERPPAGLETKPVLDFRHSHGVVVICWCVRKRYPLVGALGDY
jgi:hypothetical protein